MAKIHYIIETRKKAFINPNSREQTQIILYNPISVKMNNKILFNQGELISNDEKEKKYTISDYIESGLMCTAIAILVVITIILGFGRDLNILKSEIIGTSIGIAALLCSLSSIPLIKEKMGKIMPGSRFYKKCICLIYMLIMPYYIILLLDCIGLASSCGNICGVIGVIIFIFTW